MNCRWFQYFLSQQNLSVVLCAKMFSFQLNLHLIVIFSFLRCFTTHKVVVLLIFLIAILKYDGTVEDYVSFIYKPSKLELNPLTVYTEKNDIPFLKKISFWIFTITMRTTFAMPSSFCWMSFFKYDGVADIAIVD